jgi:glucose/arabinose dehydrogenase
MTGTITLLRGDERADFTKVVLRKPNLVCPAVRDDRLYATNHDIYAAPIEADGSLGEERIIAADMPDVGQHNDRTIAFGLDGYLYASVGSTCNECEVVNKESATMLRMRANGKKRTIFVSGLRNTIGFGWSPETHEL